MRRLLALWLALVASFWVGRIVIGVALYSNFDFTYRSLLELIVVPGLQAAVVAWAIRPRLGTPLLAPWLFALRSPALRVLLVVDAVVLVAALIDGLAQAPGLFSFATSYGLPRLVLDAKLLAGAVLLLLATRGLPRSAKLGLAALAVTVTVLASESWTGWIARGPDWLFPTQPLLARWLRFALPSLLTLILLLLGAQAALARRSKDSARAVDWVLASCMVGMGILVGGFFLHPYLREPWLSVAWCTASVAASALAIAGATALESRRRPAP